LVLWDWEEGGREKVTIWGGQGSADHDNRGGYEAFLMGSFLILLKTVLVIKHLLL
jgi:hypothetical protein